LQLFDKDGDGTVDLREAKEVLAQFDLGLSAGQINRLLGQLFSVSIEDKDSNSVRMNIQEFLGRFNMVYSSNEGKELPVSVQDLLDRIGALITKNARTKKGDKKEESKGDSRALTRYKTMSTLFTALDSSQDGMVQISEFVEGVMQVPGISELQLDGQALTKEKLAEVAKGLDVTGDGSLNYFEFLQAFEPHDQGAADLQNSLVEDVTTVLFRHRMAIRRGCHHVDEINSQKVHKEDFMDVLHGVNSALEKAERSISDSQIENLASSMAVEDQEGQMVFYEDFLRSFVILDTADDRKVVKSYGTSSD
jgi:Ca2+-binding EF-hand superfamily protein